MTIIVATTTATLDYAWLQARIASWLHRTDLTATIPDFILLAEQRLNGDLEARLQQQTTALATVVSEPLVSLPDDVNQIRSLSMTDVPGDTLEYLPTEQFNAQYGNGTVARPRNYTVVGSDIQLGPIPDAVYTLALVYKARLPALADAGSNWLLTGYPNAYLFASLWEAAIFIDDDARLPTWKEKYSDAIKGINLQDWAAGSTMRVRSDVRK